MATEAGTMAPPTVHAMPIIASTDRSLDVEPYCLQLFAHEFDKFKAIFPSDFPLGDQNTEETFLRQFFSETEIQVQGGAAFPGNGFMFLKAAWWWAARWNLNDRVPLVARHWIGQNQDVLNDPETRKHIFAPGVQPSTFFQQKELALYGDKLLRVVIQYIQDTVGPSTLPLAQNISQDTSSGRIPSDDKIAATNCTTTVPPHPNGTSDNAPTATGALASINSGAPAPRDAHAQAKLHVVDVQTHPQRPVPSLDGNKRNHSGGAFPTEGNKPGAQNDRGSHEGGSRGDHGPRVGGKSSYSNQDARTSLPPPPHVPSGGATPTAGVHMEPRTVSAGSFTPGRMEWAPHMHSGPHLMGQHPPMQPMHSLPMYGYPGQSNFHAAYQHQMSGPMNYTPGFETHHSQPFGDRSNFPTDGRVVTKESRLFDPDAKPKQSKHGQSGGSMRALKNRGYSNSQRVGGNRGYNQPLQTGGNYAKNGQSFHRNSGSYFNAPPGFGFSHNDSQYKHWQPPYQADGTGVYGQAYDHAPHTIPHALPSFPGAQASHHGEKSMPSPPDSEHPALHYPGSHKRNLSLGSTPCGLTEANKYAIGDKCTYANRLSIFQVPMDMTPETFKQFFSQFGAVEDVFLSDEQQEQHMCRRRCWVRFAHVDTARLVMGMRGAPWPGGAKLFAEVSAEHWNPTEPSSDAVQHAHKHTAAIHLNPAGGASRMAGNVPGKAATSGDPTAVAIGSDTQRKKNGKTNGNKKNKSNNKKTGSRNEIVVEAPKAAIGGELPTPSVLKSTSPHNGATAMIKETVVVNEIKGTIAVDPSPLVGPVATPTQTSAVDIDEAKQNIVVAATDAQAGVAPVSKEASLIEDVEQPIAPQVTQPVEHAVSIAVEDSVTCNPPTQSIVFAEAVVPQDSSDEATVKPSDDHIDDSFHTPDGSQGDEKEMIVLDEGSTVSATDQATTTPDDTVLPVGELAESAKGPFETLKPVPIVDLPVVLPSVAVDGSTSTSQTTAESPLAQSAPTFEPLMVKASTSPPPVTRKVTIVLPTIDTQNSATGEQEGDKAVDAAEARSASGNSISEVPASAFVTAPSTPALGAPELQVKSRKSVKPKGPAQTESFSTFAKPRSRKSSSKKPKSNVEPPPPTPPEPQVEPVTEAIDSVEQSAPPTIPPGNTTGVMSPSRLAVVPHNIANAVRAILLMTPSGSLPLNGMKSGGSATEYDNPIPADASPEAQIPVIQLPEREEGALMSTKQDPNGRSGARPGTADSTTALGISDIAMPSGTLTNGSEESAHKKRKKSKSKKQSKATADVSISSNVLNHSIPSEPIHDYKGNDATSDTSSQTFGRTSPVAKRPSSKQIDEAKQPKALLEQRPVRQNRSKKHSSVHSSKTDVTKNADEISAGTTGNTLIIGNNGAAVLVPSGSGMFIEQPRAQDEENPFDRLLEAKVTPTPEPQKTTPKPEEPYRPLTAEEIEAPSPEAQKSQERLRQMQSEEAAKKKKFA